MRDVGDPGDVDGLLHIIANKRRRMVIRLLATHQSLSLDELSKHLAAVELDKHITDVTSTERHNLYVSLYQTHLPTMDQSHIVDYDDQSKTVSIGTEFQKAKTVLECIDRVS